MTKWVDELDTVKEMLAACVPLEQIGHKYNVSKQRIYQVLIKYGLETPQKKRKSFLRDKPPKVYWVARMLVAKKVTKTERLEILESISIPDYCPVLGIKLNYDGNDKSPGWTRQDDSPSIDRIDSNKGYTADNIHIISWRANRIKNDSTPEELRKLADYIEDLTKKDLRL